MTPTALKSYTRKDLAQMARKRGVAGWHSMRKEQLVRAILTAAKPKASSMSVRRPAVAKPPVERTRANVSASRGRVGDRKKAAPLRARKRISQLQQKLDRIKNLATPPTHGTPRWAEKDRLVLMVRDPYWLHACWELSDGGVQRAQAALGHLWHTAVPVLRLFQMGEDGSAAFQRDIQIHGRVDNWYVDVENPPCRFRLEIGYLASDGTFHRLACSNSVTTPPAGASEALDRNWADLTKNADRIYAMSGGYSAQGGCRELKELLEERLGRPVGSPMRTRHGAGAGRSDAEEFKLAVDAEVVVYGVTQRDAHVTLQGEPVQLRPDGTFTVRVHMPERRQVIPVVASSNDGVEQRTISIAVERNTKVLEPVIREIGH